MLRSKGRKKLKNIKPNNARIKLRSTWRRDKRNFVNRRNDYFLQLTLVVFFLLRSFVINITIIFDNLFEFYDNSFYNTSKHDEASRIYWQIYWKQGAIVIIKRFAPSEFFASRVLYSKVYVYFLIIFKLFQNVYSL